MLTEPPEDPFLIALGSSVSDGATVDWDKAERTAADPDTQNIVRDMRRLADLVAAHRSGGMPATSDGAPIPPPAAPSRHWRHIVLFESIGAGAFGTVYRGWDPRLDREVAVKLFPTTSVDSGSPIEEARNLARVRHSNVVVVYGADREGSEAGIWMEYIEGHTLAEMVRDLGTMSAREVIGIGLDLCRALAALHGAGLLHRDIKPHNVMREYGGRIVLMDFSGAQALARTTASAVNSGTPLFMAPELFEGAAASVASEVYSLGILLFFLLSARLPVEGSSVAHLKRAHPEAIAAFDEHAERDIASIGRDARPTARDERRPDGEPGEHWRCVRRGRTIHGRHCPNRRDDQQCGDRYPGDPRRTRAVRSERIAGWNRVRP